MSPVVSTQSESLPTADNLFSSCLAGPFNITGWLSFCMANGVAGLGWNAQEARTSPIPRASKAMVAGLCAMGILLSGLHRADGAQRILYLVSTMLPRTSY